jgi:hypothetical protein
MLNANTPPESSYNDRSQSDCRKLTKINAAMKVNQRQDTHMG